MKYEKTADVYAVQFDVTTNQDANQVLVGAGTTMLEKAGFPDNWFQSDDLFKNEGLNSTTPAMLYWEKRTAGNRPDSNDDTLADEAYKDASGTKTYTYMWIMPPSVAEGIRQEETGNLLNAGLGSKESSKYTINNVTVFYAADDKNSPLRNGT